MQIFFLTVSSQAHQSVFAQYFVNSLHYLMKGIGNKYIHSVQQLICRP